MIARKRETAAVLALALVLGLLRLSLTPLWSNPEEPYHFIRLRTTGIERDPGSIPRLEQQIRGTVLVNDPSLGLVGRWGNALLSAAQVDGRDYAVEWSDDPTVLGNTQFDEPALYYVILSLSQLPLIRSDVGAQLVAARFGTLILSLLVVVLALQIAAIIFPDQPYLRIGLPLLVMVLPQFAKLVTMVNNTSLAMVAITAALWSLSRMLVRQKARYWDAALLAGSALLCILSKTTALIGLLAVVAGVLWMQRQWITRRIVVAGGTLLIVLGGLCFAPIGARNWYLPQTPVLVRGPNAPDGSRVIWLNPQQFIWQSLPLDQVEQAEGRLLLLDGWMHGDASAEIEVWAAAQDASFVQVAIQKSDDLYLSRHSTEAAIPNESRCIVVVVKNTGDAPVFVDNVSLTDADTGHNTLANGSFEHSWISLRPEIAGLLPSQLAERSLNLVWRVASLTEMARQHILFSTVVRYVFTTFWGWYGWVSPGLPVPTVAVLALTCLAAGIGLARGFLRGEFSREQRYFLLICALIGVGAMLMAVFALEPSIPFAACDRYQGRIMPAPYYVAPATVPLITLWATGLAAWVPTPYRARVIGMLALLLYMSSALALLQIEIPAYLQALGL